MSVATCTDQSYNVQIQSYLFPVCVFFLIHVPYLKVQVTMSVTRYTCIIKGISSVLRSLDEIYLYNMY